MTKLSVIAMHASSGKNGGGKLGLSLFQNARQV